ncbi:MAG TPA: manganese efflux pump [Bacteroidales bacterium]|nr:manganese efflux pump [Bacteroidales bacterium]HOG67591.1 manganese efflux pump [Bacteroidales bacterium]HPA13244.1 manganese efflux pump [Bacteroidales bacterium]HQO07988.1 manganese efflux pump [Bacteroidales bacterium]HQP53428.1 manganese efflux pump [Bacteroidales bacterium]
MDIYIIIIILALSTEVFVSIFINEFLKNARLSQILKTALIIALVSMIMAGFGILLGHEVKKLLYNIYDIISNAIFFVLGLKMLLKPFKNRLHYMILDLTQTKTLFILSLTFGINAFLAGLALTENSLATINIIMFFTIYFLIVLTAVSVSKLKSNFLFAIRADFVGGITLIIIALFSFFV